MLVPVVVRERQEPDAEPLLRLAKQAYRLDGYPRYLSNGGHQEFLFGHETLGRGWPRPTATSSARSLCAGGPDGRPWQWPPRRLGSRPSGWARWRGSW
jgi:hypothetical protein